MKKNDEETKKRVCLGLLTKEYATKEYATKKYGTKKGLTLFAEKSVLVYLQMISKTYILERN